jgi:hypothetical protein
MALSSDTLLLEVHEIIQEWRMGRVDKIKSHKPITVCDWLLGPWECSIQLNTFVGISYDKTLKRKNKNIKIFYIVF